MFKHFHKLTAMFKRQKHDIAKPDHRARSQELLAHYITLWGKPQRQEPFVHAYPQGPHPLFTLEFPAPSQHEVWVYATLGASFQPMPHAEAPEDLRMELFIYAEQQQPELLASIGALALYPFVLHTFFAPGHTVLGSDDGGIISTSPLTDILLTRADFGPDTPDYVHHSDGSHTQLLWVVPVYRQERVFAAQHGEAALIELFVQHETNVFDLWRPAVIPAGTAQTT